MCCYVWLHECHTFFASIKYHKLWANSFGKVRPGRLTLEMAVSSSGSSQIRHEGRKQAHKRACLLSNQAVMHLFHPSCVPLQHNAVNKQPQRGRGAPARHMTWLCVDMMDVAKPYPSQGGSGGTGQTKSANNLKRALLFFFFLSTFVPRSYSIQPFPIKLEISAKLEKKKKETEREMKLK